MSTDPKPTATRTKKMRLEYVCAPLSNLQVAQEANTHLHQTTDWKDTALSERRESQTLARLGKPKPELLGPTVTI